MPFLPRAREIPASRSMKAMPACPAPATRPCIRNWKDSTPEDYPAIHMMRILADVAPYSREYQKWSSIVRHQAKDNPDLLTEYERISEQVRKTKESTMQVAQRHFNAPVDTIGGTVKSASAQGVELEEYPGRTFRFSSVGTSMADLTAEMLGRSNQMTKAAAVKEADAQVDRRDRYLADALADMLN
jgi:hypothetical protein